MFNSKIQLFSIIGGLADEPLLFCVHAMVLLIHEKAFFFYSRGHAHLACFPTWNACQFCHLYANIQN